MTLLAGAEEPHPVRVHARQVLELLQHDLRSAGINPAAVLLHALAQGIEIQLLKRAFGLDLAALMGDEELSLDEINVRLDAAKTMIERIEQWPFVLVIIVGVEAG